MGTFEKLAQFFELLPGVGPRTAQRYIYFLLNQPRQRLFEFGNLLTRLAEEIKQCPKCFSFSSKDMCSLCASKNREENVLCVVAKPQDIESIEKSGQYHGLYFVLGGLVNPLLGIDPEHLRFSELIHRIKENPVLISEVILAVNPTLEGERTILYLKKILKPLGIRISIPARGLPQGADLEYADEITLSEAIKQRKEI